MLILASSSPRRRELLSQAGYQFNVFPSDADESFAAGTPPEKIVEQLACKKAMAVRKEHSADVILAADTIVVFEGQILGKPKDHADAKGMLRLLSGNRHQVFTGFCVLSDSTRHCESECTAVEFYDLTEDEIDNYVQTGEPMDKAGAYGIQGRGALLVKKIDGDFYNVMGLPIGRIHRILKNLS